MSGLPANDVRQYDVLADEWWRPAGAFEMLHWIAQARAELVPPATRDGAVLVDVGCGAGLLAPHLRGKGYRHVGVDLTASALGQAAAHGVTPVRGDALALPLADAVADVVSAGELLEHVPDLAGAVAEVCRVLRPGGLLVLDTLNATLRCRLVAVELGERLPMVPRGIHDPALFVDPRRLTAECARHGVRLFVRGLRPTGPALADWLLRAALPRTARAGSARTGTALTGTEAARPLLWPVRRRMVPVRSTALLYQGRGLKSG
ncbi:MULTISPECIES: methyltransferase domain-containing protein [unclassified Solwaraspora]|uniref:methyltransferase domain-containing protein n=1 Tax=unclassified Solwaraspora TaxID=2627926 RepID=UPI00259BD1D0|nr:methyltransferase domain-containing protein [Solwaraspora sp. WMMA2056]WJK41168.1 methyltransferase domain-containing protein [Solwaraspora sp. WMMA2056]